MSKVIFIDQGHPDDCYYDRADEDNTHGYNIRDLTLEELGLTEFAKQLDQFIEEVGPVLGSAVLDIGNMNDMCMKLTELKNRTE